MKGGFRALRGGSHQGYFKRALQSIHINHPSHRQEILLIKHNNASTENLARNRVKTMIPMIVLDGYPGKMHSHDRNSSLLITYG